MMINKIKPLLNNISARLWDGRAAILIGAGFSRNATPLTNKARKFPMWNDLGDIFYESVYCEKNSNKYSNVLKLGDEVQAAFGRAILDKLIMDNVPDKEYEPSKLHVSLLSLPWIDVFTTNYDTLLERACVNVDSRKYDIVLNKSDLMNAERPRIIKLHGSFPSERPFIVTEEDYRKYPLENSLFVNTVQQSLIENTLCLIGFSGDDPNFLNWIGWIRDNLGVENSPKIYLVGLFSFNEAQRKLLEKRNISIVDLSFLGDFGKDHYLAHQKFIQFLYDSKNKENLIEWPIENNQDLISFNDNSESKLRKIKECISNWSQTRKLYPNWLILPEPNRRRLWQNTRNWLHIVNHKITWENSSDLDFGYEITWRLNKALTPIFKDTFEFLFKLVDKYSVNYIDKNNKIIEFDEKYSFIIISLMRFCRQESFIDKWEKLNDILIQNIDRLTPEVKSNYYYENILFLYFNLNFDEARTKLSNWEINKLLPHHEIKKAGLLAEFGMLDEAINHLEETLSTIRKNSLLSSRNIDYSSESQEAYGIYILRIFKHSWRLASRDDDYSSEYNARLATLSQYRSDPEKEIKYLDIKLESLPGILRNTNDSDFDLNRRSVETYFGESSTDTRSLDAFSFFLLAEELGLPFHIPGMNIFSEIVENAARHIYPFSPEWAIFSIFRTFNRDKAKSLFNRNRISSLEPKKVESLFDGYYKKYEQIVTKKIDDRLNDDLEIEISTLTIIPEILSRLVTKVSFEKKKDIINLLFKLFNSANFHGYADTKDLLKRTISNLNDHQKISLIDVFIDFPSAPPNGQLPINQQYGFITPFECLLETSIKISKEISKKIKSEKLKKDIRDLKSENHELRKAASQKLILLYNLDMLNKSDINKLIKNLWSKTDDYGFPIDSGYYKFFFINNLHPENENIIEKFLPIIESYEFPIQEGTSVSIKNGFNEYCTELNGSLRYINLPEQILSEIILRMTNWYDKDRIWLKERDHISKEFIFRFRHITNIVTTILENHKEKLNAGTINSISNLLERMKSDKVPVNSAVTMLLLKDKKSQTETYKYIENGLYSFNGDDVIEAINSIYVLIRNNEYPSNIIEILSDKIAWNRDPKLPECYDLVGFIINSSNFSLSDEIIEKILLGLAHIINIDDNSFNNNNDYLNHLEKKLSATKLAAFIYRRNESLSLKQSHLIQDWENMCNSRNEFDEIRNEWNNHI
ncbi:anti-phage defense-associated sirtuin Dsr2 [Providencia sp. PROV255]|uniref:anti-phage defense-associated sirtuin Dsr2 n=1 Tax=Providencia sp. PROV255 TaxID=2949943 RepID=UPI00234A6C3E|nr:anti-phage defense-associated sirtuin Dsr2 [Providencia sp. PROV255]